MQSCAMTCVSSHTLLPVIKSHASYAASMLLFCYWLHFLIGSHMLGGLYALHYVHCLEAQRWSVTGCADASMLCTVLDGPALMLSIRAGRCVDVHKVVLCFAHCTMPGCATLYQAVMQSICHREAHLSQQGRWHLCCPSVQVQCHTCCCAMQGGSAGSPPVSRLSTTTHASSSML